MTWIQLWFHPEIATPGEDVPDVVSKAVPMWAGMITTELLISYVVGKKLYNLRQSISNLSAGLLALLFMGVLAKAMHVLPYLWIYNNYRLLEWAPEHDWWMNVVAFLFCDLAFYVVHRLMHESNLGWSAHVVHHSSMDYNYTTALRQGFGETVASWIFYLPLALVCPPKMYALHRGINTVYQSFTHTELIDKLWWPIELIMVTPSHHRVHHARNYGRKNHGGILIIWDRMFGTFQEEMKSRKPIYGLNAQPVTQGTFNPLWHQVHHLVATIRLAVSGRVSAWQAVSTRVTGPGMIHPSITAALDETVATKSSRPGNGQKGRNQIDIPAHAVSQEKPRYPAFPWDRRALGPLDYYAAFHFFLVVVPASFYFLAITRHLSPAYILGGGIFSAWSLIILGWLCGGEAVVVKHELIRLVAQASLAMRWLHSTALPWLEMPVAPLIVGLSVVSFLFVLAQLPTARPHATKKSV